MNELVVTDKAAEWRKLKALVLDSVSSPITKRVYNLGLDQFINWYTQEPRAGFTKALVSAWPVSLEACGLGSVSINVRITAVRKLAVEAADNGLLAPELAAGIARIKGVRSQGVRTGNWLTIQQAQTLLNTPDITTKKGLRDRAMFATLLGCGLRRSEIAALTMRHIQQRDNRWCVVDLVGKHNRVRTVPMPTWVKNAIDAWTFMAAVTDGYLFRPIHRGDQVSGVRISEKVVWQLLRPYAAAAGFPGIASHDLRRTCAKMCRAAGGELEQIQLLLGHSSVQTTERYLGTKQDLAHAPNDGIKLTLASASFVRPRDVSPSKVQPPSKWATHPYALGQLSGNWTLRAQPRSAVRVVNFRIAREPSGVPPPLRTWYPTAPERYPTRRDRVVRRFTRCRQPNAKLCLFPVVTELRLGFRDRASPNANPPAGHRDLKFCRV